MKYPLLGVSGSMDRDETRQYILWDYMQCLCDAGAVPLLLSPAMATPELTAGVQRLDGLMLAGGNDVDPCYFGEQPIPELGEVNPLRDKLELSLIQAFYAAGKPIFGICRGAQMLNVALGGAVYQDLASQYPGSTGSKPLAHQQTSLPRYPSHGVDILENSLLYHITGVCRLKVNSMHHQAISKVAPGLTVCARAADGVVEAVEDASRPFVLGVQWHPERMASTDAAARKLFEAFVKAAQAVDTQA